MFRRGRWSLFGPVLFYELLRTGRRGRYIAARAAYGLVLLVVLLCVYIYWFPQKLDDVGAFFASGALPPRDLIDFSASFFSVFMAIQLAVVFSLTPAYTAGAIAEEKERGTLEALLASDLRGREIVLGKAAARLANLVLLVAVGLPILGALQFLGGVDPNLVLAGFAVTGLGMVSLTSLGILCSVRARKPRDAVIRTYVVAFLYLLLSGASWLLLLRPFNLATWPSTEDWLSPVTLDDLVHWINIGNPVALVAQVAADVRAGGGLYTLLLVALRRYAWFHVLVTVGCLGWAVACLRTCALRQNVGAIDGDEEAPRSVLWAWLTRARPRVFRPCVLWKEVFVDESPRRGWLRKLLAGVALAALFFPAVHLVGFFGRLLPNEPNDQLSVLMNVWVRGAGMALGSFMLLVVAFEAAASVSSERDRQTFDGLLTTPLTNRSILFGKWLGSILSPRTSWLCLGLVGAVGVTTGGLHPLAIPWFLAAWLVFAALAASVGLWFSVAERRTYRTTFWTALAVVAVYFLSLLAAWDLPEAWVKQLPVYVLTPSGILAWVAFPRAEYHGEVIPQLILDRPIIPAFLLFWSVAAAMLWLMAVVRFRVTTKREQIVPTPAVPPPEPKANVQGDNHEQIPGPGALLARGR